MKPCMHRTTRKDKRDATRPYYTFHRKFITFNKLCKCSDYEVKTNDHPCQISKTLLAARFKMVQDGSRCGSRSNPWESKRFKMVQDES